MKAIPMTEEDIIGDLAKRVQQLEETLQKISTLNSLGKTLQIEQEIFQALNNE